MTDKDEIDARLTAKVAAMADAEREARVQASYATDPKNWPIKNFYRLHPGLPFRDGASRGGYPLGQLPSWPSLSL